MRECPHCQRALPEPPGRFCPYCGGELQAVPAAPWFPPAAPPAPEPALPPPPAPPWGPPPPRASAGGRSGPTASAGGRSGPTPWEIRDQIGLGTALIETTRQVLTSPTAFFRSMAVTGGIGGPLLYAVIVGYLGLLATAIYDAILRGVLGNPFGYFRGNEQLEQFLTSLHWGANLAVQVLLGPLFVVIGLFVFAGITHLMLLMVGGAGNGFEATLRASAYSEAAMVIGIVPLCGSLISAVVFVVLAIIGIGEAHGISKGKAALAVLMPFILLCCCCGVTLGVVLGGLAGALGRMS